MASPSLILGSESVYKRSLFSRLGLEHQAIAADIVEEILDGEHPRQTALRLSRAKAKVVLERLEEPGWVIAGDQVIALGSEQLRKPVTAQRCIEQLQQLSGKTHDLYCGIALACPDGRILDAMVQARMQMRALTQAEIEAYVALDMPTDCAGSYKLEDGGVRLFHRMECDDYTAIVGLPLTRVWELLEAGGYFEAHPPA